MKEHEKLLSRFTSFPLFLHIWLNQLLLCHQLKNNKTYNSPESFYNGNARFFMEVISCDNNELIKFQLSTKKSWEKSKSNWDLCLLNSIRNSFIISKITGNKQIIYFLYFVKPVLSCAYVFIIMQICQFYESFSIFQNHEEVWKG
jgi:hypothetical protein